MSESLGLRLLRTNGPVVDDVRSESPSSSSSGQSHRDSRRTRNVVTSFKSVQWTADGTTVLAMSTDNTVQTYILPPDLLESSDGSISPYHVHQAPSPLYAVAASPSYELSEPASCLYLTSPASLPIRLISPFTPDLVAAYPLTNTNTEAYIAPHSLAFSLQNPHQFIAGSDSQVSVFDLSRPGTGPLLALPTIPSKRKRIVGGGVGMKGIVSALAPSSQHGMLAAATFSRWVGLYDADGAGDAVGVFQLPTDRLAGAGVTGMQWSGCGRYLYVAERAAHGIGVWDVRDTGRRLAWLAGRHANTMQRLAFDAVGSSVWAGGTDGRVRVWQAVGAHEGEIEPEVRGEEVVEEGTEIVRPWAGAEVHPGCAVAAAAVHPSGSVLATCGSVPLVEKDGCAEEDEDSEEASGSEGDRDEEMHAPQLTSTLKLWACQPSSMQAALADRTLAP